MNSIDSGKIRLDDTTAPKPRRTAFIRPASGRPRLGRVWLAAAGVVSLGLLAGFWPRWQQRVALRRDSVDLGVQYVNVVQPRPGTNQTELTLPGEAQPFIEAPIYARVDGYLRRWYADLGQAVKQGELLAEIETPELDQQLAQARADLTRAEANLELARITAARWQDLLKTASVSEQEAAEKTAGLATASAVVQAARANVRRLEDLQSFERVVAPFAGVVTDRQTDIGQLVKAAAGRELFRLAQTTVLRIYVRVPQTVSAWVALGQPVELFLDEKSDRVFTGTVVRTAGAIDPASRTLLTEIQYHNEAGDILAGAYVRVRFHSPASAPTLVLPANTLLFRAEGTQVGVVGQDGRVQLRNLKVGRDFGTSIEVLSGVTAADRVILNPSDSLAAGDAVRIGNTDNP